MIRWISIMAGGLIDLKPPLLHVISFIVLLIIGGFTGLILGALAVNVQAHDTPFVIAHFHYIIFGGIDFAFFTGIHYLYPGYVKKTL